MGSPSALAMVMWWIVSAPGGQQKKHVLDQCKSLCKSEDSVCADFPVPELKVKNLSSLMNLTDDMGKFEERTEATLKRLHRNYGDLGPDPSQVLGIDWHRGFQTPEEYMKTFEWDERKYMAKADLAGLASTIFAEICDMDNDVKNKQAELATTNSRLNAIQRKRSGNLLNRDLSDLIKAEHYVKDPVTKRLSEKIIPYFVVVSKQRESDFRKCYERFTEYVVPRSAQEVQSDDKDYMLFRILHLNVPALEDTLKTNVEDKKFLLRPFEFQPQQASETSQEERELIHQQDNFKKEVLNAIRTNFSEMFMGWFHLKAIRVFVESVLWYSLPPNFQVMIIAPNERHEQSLRAKLAKQFKDAKCSQANMSSGDEDDAGNYPYVNLDLEMDWLTEDGH